MTLIMVALTALAMAVCIVFSASACRTITGASAGCLRPNADAQAACTNRQHTSKCINTQGSMAFC
eukprot:CAMPEP_0203844734 /NCGR_PEP_ID=MMETSP0359-20131031/3385_1 /ASSEMBLY_ACC=CAM_ASM_000338 /TAXON_ID=268821 /ORGANISM="Scrippsiella Hangoei, Strain SHTV-5" /LENGTH=64 /DNA_ID=CAMNT_0050759739 /DNA_START=253 /DNA_END=444 /DNA_ORIENTATION=-